MLFLFNDVVFDLGDVHSVLRSGKLPLRAEQIAALTVGQLNTLVREAVFRDQDVARHKPEHVRHLCALIFNLAPGANSLLAVRPENAVDWRAVGLRYAQVPLPTLAYLWAEQEGGRLTAGRVNSAVWLAGQGNANDSRPLPSATGTG